MKYSIAACLALGCTQVQSFSFPQLVARKSAPKAPPSPPADDRPFFFTDGVKDPITETPDFFFTDQSPVPSNPLPPPSKPMAKSSSDYLKALGLGVTLVGGPGITSYLDALPKNPSTTVSGKGITSYASSLNQIGKSVALPPPSKPTAKSSSDYLKALGLGVTLVGGPGMTSYLDALPKNPARVGGKGIISYAASLGQATADVSAESTYTQAPTTPAGPVSGVPSTPASPHDADLNAPDGNYLDALSVSSTSGLPSGRGIFGYLDGLPRAAAATGGAGIQTYKDSIPVTNTAAGTGAGMTTYTSSLSRGSSVTGKAYTPFVSKPTAPEGSFAMGSVTGRFDMTLQAGADMIAQLQLARNQPLQTSETASFV